MNNQQTHCTVDVRRDICPMSFVKLRLALEALQPATCLEALIADSKTADSIILSVMELGHDVVSSEPLGTAIRLVIRRNQLRG